MRQSLDSIAGLCGTVGFQTQHVVWIRHVFQKSNFVSDAPTSIDERSCLSLSLQAVVNGASRMAIPEDTIKKLNECHHPRFSCESAGNQPSMPTFRFPVFSEKASEIMSGYGSSESYIAIDTARSCGCTFDHTNTHEPSRRDFLALWSWLPKSLYLQVILSCPSFSEAYNSFFCHAFMERN